jgi:hypothetical protein
MRPERIFAPMSVLALWTGGVLLLTGVRRVWAVARGRISSDAFRVGESPAVPLDVAVINRNFMNLLEMPVLFYVVCMALYTTRNVAPGTIVLAWAFVALRLAHSAIHLTYNRVVHRLLAFIASNVVLLWLWIWFMWQVF